MIIQNCNQSIKPSFLQEINSWRCIKVISSSEKNDKMIEEEKCRESGNIKISIIKVENLTLRI